MRTKIIMPTAYFPPIEWWAYILSYDSFEIEIFETYSKQTIRNHCIIASSQGKQKLIVPINKTSGNHTITKDITIDYSQNWIRQHMRSIDTAYNKSVYYEYFKDDISLCLKNKYKYLIDLNYNLVQMFFKWLQIKQNINYTTQFVSADLLQDLNKTEIVHLWENRNEILEYNPYCQVFDDKMEFIPNLSIIDLFFNLGLDSYFYLQSLTKNINKK